MFGHHDDPKVPYVHHLRQHQRDKEGKIPKLPAILGVPCCNRLLSGYSSHLGQREQVCHTDTHTHVRGLVRAHSPLLGLFVFWR